MAIAPEQRFFDNSVAPEGFTKAHQMVADESIINSEFPTVDLEMANGLFIKDPEDGAIAQPAEALFVLPEPLMKPVDELDLNGFLDGFNAATRALVEHDNFRSFYAEDPSSPDHTIFIPGMGHAPPTAEQGKALLAKAQAYSTKSQMIIKTLGEEGFSKFLGNDGKTALSSGSIHDREAKFNLLFSQYFALDMQAESIKSAIKADPALLSWTGPVLNNIDSMPVQKQVQHLAKLSQNFRQEQAEARLQIERQAAEEARAREARAAAERLAAEQERTAAKVAEEEKAVNAVRNLKAAEEASKLLTESLAVYLLAREKNPIDIVQKIDELSPTEFLNLVRKEQQDKQYRKFANANALDEGLNNVGPNGLVLSATIIPRINVIKKLDDGRSKGYVLLVSGKKVKVTATELSEVAIEKTQNAKTVLAQRASEALEDWNKLSPEVQKDVQQKLGLVIAAGVIAFSGANMVSSPADTPVNSQKAQKTLVAKPQSKTAGTPVSAAAAANASPAVTGGTVPQTDLTVAEAASQAIERLTSDKPGAAITKKSKPAVMGRVEELTRARVTMVSALRETAEPSLANNEEIRPTVVLIDRLALLGLKHTARGKLKEGEVDKISTVASAIMLAGRHPVGTEQEFRAKLAKLRPTKDEINIATFVKKNALAEAEGYTNTQKEIVGLLIARMLNSGLKPSDRDRALAEFKSEASKIVAETNAPPAAASAASPAPDPTPARPKNKGLDISPSVGKGMSEKGKRNFRLLLEAAAEEFNVDPHFLAAFNYVENIHAGDSRNTRDAASGTPVAGDGNFQEPRAPYGKGKSNGISWAGAKGPQQFIDSTWDAYGVDGNGDGVKDVHNLNDALKGAAKYIAALGGTKGASDAELRKAAFGYNHSSVYVQSVMNTYYYHKRRAKAAEFHQRAAEKRAERRAEKRAAEAAVARQARANEKAAAEQQAQAAAAQAAAAAATQQAQASAQAANVATANAAASAAAAIPTPVTSPAPPAATEAVADLINNASEAIESRKEEMKARLLAEAKAKSRHSEQDKIQRIIDERAKILKNVVKVALQEYKKNGNRPLEIHGANTGPQVQKYTGGPSGPSAPWCAWFASWVYKHADYELKGGPADKWGRIASVNGLSQWFQEYGIHFTPASKELKPKAGDVIMYGDSHTGIVVKANGDWITTVEGNTSGNGTYNADGGTVGMKSFNINTHPKSGQIEFGRPKDPTL